MAETRLEIDEGPRGQGRDRGAVPPPLPPDDPEAWYAPTVRAQYEVHPGVVVTVARRRPDFAYRVREPALNPVDAAAVDRIERRLADARIERPRTREGAVEVMAAGPLELRWRGLDRTVRASPAARRRVRYHALSRTACLDDLTPYALDDRIEVADPGPERLVVHTGDFAPAVTDLPPDATFLDRFASERTDRYAVEFCGFEVPVVRRRTNLLGGDPFERSYAALEPRLGPGEEVLVEECATRLRELDVADDPDGAAGDLRRAARSLVRRRTGRGRVGTVLDRVRAILGAVAPVTRPVHGASTDERVADLTYRVLRDAVGFGPLTIPLVDPETDGVEAGGAGERILVRDGDDRIPTNCRFADDAAFSRALEELARAGGVGLDPQSPIATVTVTSPGMDAAARGGIVHPAIGRDGPHVAIRKPTTEASTPVDLVASGAVDPAVLALVWLCLTHRRAVLVSGPDGLATSALLTALAPFVPAAHRPVAVAPGRGEIDLPHETGVSLVASEHGPRATGELLGDAVALDPGVVLASEIGGESAFRALGEHVNAGRGVLATTTARDVDVLVERALDRGMVPSNLCEVDLVLFPERIDGEVAVAEVVELLPEAEYRELDHGGTVSVRGTAIHWNALVSRSGDEGRASPDDDALPADWTDQRGARLLSRVADATDRSVEAVREEFRRKRRYVEYLHREGIDDRETLCDLLADLETDEAATVERLNRRPSSGGSGTTERDRTDRAGGAGSRSG